MNTPLPSATLADVWRNPRDPRWRESHEAVSRVFHHVARHHPRLKALAPDERDDACADLLAGFWCHLTCRPAVLEARRVRSSGALRVECWRFLDRELVRLGGRDPSHARQLMLAHLHGKKVGPALRHDVRFARDAVSRLWQLSAWSTGGPADRVPMDDDALAAALPLVPSRLVAQRGDQVPPLVDQEHVPDFLAQALEQACRPRTEWALTKLLWARLRPSPDAVFLADEHAPSGAPPSDEPDHPVDGVLASEVDAPDVAAARERWAQRVDIVASDIVEALTPRQRAVAAGRLRQLPNEDVCQRLGIRRGTLHNELLRFRTLCEEAADAEDLDEGGMRLLIEALLNILGAEGFPAAVEAST